MRPSSSDSTALADVGLIEPKRFALGAASGLSKALITRLKMALELTRTATVGNPAVTRSGTIDFFGSSSVNGPGQKRSTSRLMVGAISCGTSAIKSS